jgi:Baseplate J-like protein
MMFHCCELRRLEVLRRSGSKNAIEFLEVLDHAAPLGVPPQRTLFVRLLHPATTLTTDNLRITGGARIPTVDIEWVAPGDALPPQAEPDLVDGLDELPRTLVIRTASSGDFSRYTLAIVANSGADQPPTDFDPLLSRIEFSFKVECPTDFDCDAPLPCAPAPVDPPRINYLAKDYAGFRRLMLDRLSLLVPGWQERSAADLGVTLVELLAFAADTLSYRQDVIANEAYLNTARQRISVRRHARLVDYYLHEGCDARAFVHFRVLRGAGPQLLPWHTRLFTSAPGAPAVIEPGSAAERAARAAGVLVFETAHAATLHASLNELDFYTWGDEDCCLPRGATRATLAGALSDLKIGDFLVFQEVLNPRTGEAADADRTHRHVVRLTRVVTGEDPSGRLFEDPPVDAPTPITTIEWDASDALPFTLCISAPQKPRVSVALGNIVLADHGETVSEENLGEVPKPPKPFKTRTHVVGECCDSPPVIERPPRYRPLLEELPVTHGFDFAALLDPPVDAPQNFWSAAALGALDARAAKPQVAPLTGTLDDQDDEWFVQRDLLGSDGQARDFTVEVRDDGRAQLRFGDGTHGLIPKEHTRFNATYRKGNGAVGNVGAGSIAHLMLTPALAIEGVTNPMPAFGGTEAEDIEAARRDAPQAFRTQQRAVTAADYAAASERRSDVQRAAASFRWTGSWHTVFVTADRIGGAAVDSPFETALRSHLERFRMAGYDLEVDAPRLVPLDLELHICVKPGHFRSQVLAVVRDVLSSAQLADGRLGIFHPDNFTFGQPVYASRVVAAAQAVEGVESVRLDRFEKLADPDPATLAQGVIPIGRLEIAQLANDPNYRDRGRLRLSAGGGQ